MLNVDDSDKILMTLCFLRRCNNNVEFFHYIEWVQIDTAGRVEPDCDECMGRRVHVFHLCVVTRVRMRQLCGAETTPTQCCLPTRRKSSHTGEYSFLFASISLSRAASVSVSIFYYT